MTLTARVTDRAGKQSKKQVRFFPSVDSERAPTANLRATPADALAVDFSGASSRDADGLVVAWEWYFGDGSTGLGRDIRKTYTAAGEYTVRLRVRDNQGGIDVAKRTIRVGEAGLVERVRHALPFD